MLNLLRCSVCHGTLLQQTPCLRCPRCEVSYKVIENIPDMLPSHLRRDIYNSVSGWEDINYVYDLHIDNTPKDRLSAIDGPLLNRVKGKVLEVGCGTARLHYEVSKRGCDYAGIDPSRKLLEQGYRKGVHELVRGVGEYLPFPDNHFDTVIGGYHSFRYIDLEKGFSECSRVLKHGGLFAFTLWNYWSLNIHALLGDIKNMRFPRKPFPAQSKDIICNDVFWVRNEVHVLQNAGFAVTSLLSTKRWPLPRFSFLKKIANWQGYWHGTLGAFIGYDIIFICRNEKL